MDELSRKFRAIDWKGLQKSAKKMQASTASALKDMVMTDLENKTRAVTADTAWGASNTDLTLIAQGTYNRDDYGLIMSIVWQRLSSTRWRCVHKALHLLTFLVMHGSARCAEEARAAMPHLRALESYVARENGRDMAEGVRLRAAKLCDMLTNPQLLDEEREESNRLRGKITGGSGSASNFSAYSTSSGGANSGTGMNSSMRHAGFASDTSYYGNKNQRNSEPGQSTFRGYDDDDDTQPSNSAIDGEFNPRAPGSGFSYDDGAAPAGTFAKRAAAAARGNDLSSAPHVDLLSDGPAGADNSSDIDDDDDDFDPRASNTTAIATSAAPPHVAGSDADIFNTLALVPSNTDGTAPTFASNSQTQSSMPTSQLVQQLAAAATANNSASAPVSSLGNQQPAENTQLSAAPVAEGNPFTGFGTQTGNAQNNVNLNVQTQTKVESGESTIAPAPRKLERKETDPFGDLLSTAKQKGVL